MTMPLLHSLYHTGVVADLHIRSFGLSIVQLSNYHLIIKKVLLAEKNFDGDDKV